MSDFQIPDADSSAVDNNFPVTNADCELIIAFVGAVGVKLSIAQDAVANRLDELDYHSEIISVSRDILPKIDKTASQEFSPECLRIRKLMDIGNDARGSELGTNILAKGVAQEIKKRRSRNKGNPRVAYLIRSLKHPDEVRELRQIYSRGFYLIGVHAHPDIRRDHLMSFPKMSYDDAQELMSRDKEEDSKHGQQVNKTFHLADFFVGWGGEDDYVEPPQSIALKTNAENASQMINTKRVESSIRRFIDIIFGDPYKTPSFGEHAMFQAFSASLRSADLSRQVGAVVARDGEVLSTGANDCPRPGGGLYWPKYDANLGGVNDISRGRDYMRRGDNNRIKQVDLIQSIVAKCNDPKLMLKVYAKIRSVIKGNEKVLRSEEGKEVAASILKDLKDSEWANELIQEIEQTLMSSDIKNLTEYGRVVHAEMEALLACARKGLSTVDAAIYCTTFPCHNCAKHIIASGINRVIFIEPYLKSKAFEFYDDAIKISYPQDGKIRKEDALVRFEPFFGVGPRRFLDLFSMNLGSGHVLKRKDNQSGKTVDWPLEGVIPRLAMHPLSYIDLEAASADSFAESLEGA